MIRLKENILATLAYFDMFEYPLTSNEVFSFLENRYDSTEFAEALDQLCTSRLTFRIGDYYSLRANTEVALTRKEGNRKAIEMLKIAKRVGKLLILFPYVRGVGISGSLSKNFADANSDIDLFIITKKDRIWIARTLMHCFKKLTFIVNRQHYYCMNYYVDEHQLEIVEKNIYTAIEVATLIPLQGRDAFEEFYAANSWAKAYLPNKFIGLSATKKLRGHVFKKLVEWLLNNVFGNWLEASLMRITAKRWNRKTIQKKRNVKGNIMSMAASKHVAKPDPMNFQVRFIKAYQEKVFSLIEQSRHDKGTTLPSLQMK
jgi:hypothetical protein